MDAALNAIPAAATPNRWRVAVAGTLLQLCLGTVYAWSFFQDKLPAAYNWSNTQVALAFSLAICFLGIAAAWGGINLARHGPRKLAMLGGTLFGGGYLLAALALHLRSLPLLYAGYGVIGGIGLGLGYVTPVATAAKWFPDKKGLVTGMVVMGFGFGALLMSKVLAPGLARLTQGNYVLVFAGLGVILMLITVAMALNLRNPPPGYVPAGFAASSAAKSCADLQHDRLACLLSGRFGLMWVVFFCNIAAGIAIITFQSPLLQDVWKKTNASLSKETLASYGTTLIAVSSLCNGLGRFFWGGLSDRIGRVQAFRIMLASQIVVFIALMHVGSPWLFGVLICYILLCYGGGFGTMPSFVMDVFGGRMMAVVYGAILTAWSAAGIAGPQLFAFVKDKLPLEKASTYPFIIGAAFLGLGLLCSLAGLNNRAFRCGRNKAQLQPDQAQPRCGRACVAQPAE